MVSENDNTNVTWKGLIALCGGVVVMPVVITWILLSEHGTQPHDGAARQYDLVNIKSDIQNLGARFENDIRSLRIDVKENRQLLINLMKQMSEAQRSPFSAHEDAYRKYYQYRLAPESSMTPQSRPQ